jgi:hypothetical protein
MHARMLVEAGFEYVCEIEKAKLFRKRKQENVVGLFQNNIVVPRAGLEPATTRSSASPSMSSIESGALPV